MPIQKRVILRMVIALSAGLMVFTLWAAQTPATGTDNAAAQQGAGVFHETCARCHSITGVGGDRGPDLSAVGKHMSAAKIQKQVLKGGHGMPPFANVLNDDQIKDVVAFLGTCKTKEAPGCRSWGTGMTAAKQKSQ
jgi:mono/diheme cytochrome c family protein